MRPGSRIDRDLTKTGMLFRSHIEYLTFDRFSIEIASKDLLGRKPSVPT
jgi:hypothetical protein